MVERKSKASLRQSLDQERAEHALADATEVNTKASLTFKARYAGLARKAPANIQSSGLGQTLAFWRSKAGRNENEHQLINRHLSAWVLKRMGQPESGDLLDWVVKQDSATYRRAATEALAYLGWLKRFSEALLPEPEEDRD